MKFLVSFALLFALVSCHKTEYETVYVGSVNAPSTANVNEVVQVTIDYVTPTSGGSFHEFIETESNTTRHIEVIGRFGPDATSASAYHTASYPFKALSSGTYSLNFKSGPSTYITKTIVVN